MLRRLRNRLLSWYLRNAAQIYHGNAQAYRQQQWHHRAEEQERIAYQLMRRAFELDLQTSLDIYRRVAR